MDHDLSSPSVDRDADDPRYQMAAMAARRARRNRPRRLVALALAVLLGAGVIALWGAVERAAAASRLRSARTEQHLVSQLVPQYEQARSRGAENPYQRVPDLVTRIQGYAREAGLDNPLPNAPSSDRPSGALEETTVRISGIRNREFGPVATWLTRVVEEIPGIEITSLVIEPIAQGWNVDVVFVKPYRPQSERSP